MAHRKSGSTPAIGTYGVEKTVGQEKSQLFPVLGTQARVPPDTDAVKAAFDKLMRGLAHGFGEQTYSGYRTLYEFGHAVVPALEQRILEADWTAVTRPEATRMQTALVTLLHDIDEARSRDVIDRLLTDGCHPALRGALNSIRRYDGRNFKVHELRGLRVFIDNGIDHSEAVRFHLDRWLSNVPATDLWGITRLYILPVPPVPDHAGLYMPILSTITVYWRASLLWGLPPGWLERLLMERTLYHEIGHHVHRHEFGQQPEQEREADRYAYERLRLSRPFLVFIAQVIRRVLPRRFCEPYSPRSRR